MTKRRRDPRVLVKVVCNIHRTKILASMGCGTSIAEDGEGGWVWDGAPVTYTRDLTPVWYERGTDFPRMHGGRVDKPCPVQGCSTHAQINPDRFMALVRSLVWTTDPAAGHVGGFGDSMPRFARGLDRAWTVTDQDIEILLRRPQDARSLLAAIEARDTPGRARARG